MERVEGELVALAQLQDEAGELRLVAISASKNGPVVGILASPANGGEGSLGFVPVPALFDAAIQVPELELLLNEAAEERGPDPNDPRGLRAGVQQRRPGMTS